MTKWFALITLIVLIPCVCTQAEEPLRIIFDTDMGNDVDDALALGIIHALQDRGECEIIAVTVTKDHSLSAPYVDLLNTFYGRGDIPIGVVKEGPTKGDSKFTILAKVKDGNEQRYPHDLLRGENAPEATTVLRKVLAAQPDHSVVIAQVGFSTNLARLLDTEADAYSPLNGRELVALKVKTLSIMAGAFTPINGNTHREYNVVMDIPAAQQLAEFWPTSIIFSGFEIGLAILYPAASIDHDFRYAVHHPVQEAYQLYGPTPRESPTWDLTSVLWAVRPQRGYFDLSPKGRVTVDDKGETRFKEDPTGKHQYLIVTDIQKARVREALALLASQPPLNR